MLTNTVIWVTFGNLRTQQISQISSIIFQCSMLYHTEFDSLWLFIHLRPRKKCLSQIQCILLSFKENIVWKCTVGAVISPFVVFISLAEKAAIDYCLFFSQLLRILFSLKLRNKKWGSPCSFKRKGAVISQSSLVWGKSLTFCSDTGSCASCGGSVTECKFRALVL